jgi:L-ascorbate metabolism protein UlaG (beta-lactamase superfamily)
MVHAEEGFSLKVTSGQILIEVFNSHAGLLLKTITSTVIFDPKSIDPTRLPIPDIIIITHEHWDHLDIPLIIALQQRGGAMVLTTPFIGSLLHQIPHAYLKLLEPEDTFSYQGCSFNALISRHPGYQPLAFLITTQEGVRLYHPSDSDPFTEMGLLAAYPGVDILVYLGDSLRKVIQIATLVKPRTILYRYIDGEALSTETGVIAKHLDQHEVYLYTASDKPHNLHHHKAPGGLKC